ncbi:hypothetical protein T440DRAFT_466506 [Plenodomus tracheiphilus IPT5]|uniref:Uncharacterized protein n=1 Tax=Plenodomus tracheiphilus IPT5 TaxID=1408161 RepID=A0A6A7BBN7_9PLEO|nr:hypothetical protein T440DRAFT_466506 [Plenodomus tracheiphilus IPT5]
MCGIIVVSEGRGNWNVRFGSSRRFEVIDARELFTEVEVCGFAMRASEKHQRQTQNR